MVKDVLVKQTIQQLRTWLNELKQIGKHLRSTEKIVEGKKSKASGSSLNDIEYETGLCLCQAEQNKELLDQHPLEQEREK